MIGDDADRSRPADRPRPHARRGRRRRAARRAGRARPRCARADGRGPRGRRPRDRRGRAAYGVTTGVGVRKTFPIVEADGARPPARVASTSIAQGRPRHTTSCARRHSGSRTRSRRHDRRLVLCSPQHVVDGAERRPAARGAPARIGRPGRSRADGRPRRRDCSAASSWRRARRSRCSTRTPSRRASRHSRSTTRSRCSTRSTSPGRSTTRRSARTAMRSHPAIGDARPYPGLQATLERLGGLLEGSGVEARGAAGPAELPDARRS